MVRTSLTSLIRGSGAPLLWRVFAFLVIFVIVSGLLGPKIISSGILFRYHFDIYGGAGKMFLFGAIVFALLAWRKPVVALQPWRRFNIFWLAMSLLWFVVAMVAVGKLQAGVEGLLWPVLTHFSLLACLAIALVGVFGPANLRRIVSSYRRELLVSLGLAIGFYVFLQAVYGLWEYLATVVLYAVRGLLELIGIDAHVFLPRTLLLDKFGVEIAQYCSGIESIALFTGLYAIIGLLDWPRLRHRAFLLVFPFALLLLFAFNILRVFGLIVAGYYIDQEIAFSLFHTYAGMVFFIVYSGIFWSIAYKRMIKA